MISEYSFIKNYLVLFFAVCLLASCSASKELPPKPDYGTRADYPELYEDNPSNKNAGNNTVKEELPEHSNESVQKMQQKWMEFSKKRGCKQQGHVMVSFVVTKDGIIDAPIVENSTSKKCKEAALLALRYFEIETPGKSDGRPVSVLMTIPLITR